MILTEQQEMIRESAARFAAERLAPNSRRWEEAGAVDPDVLREMGRLGFMGMTVPEVYGGAGLDYVSYALALMEIAARKLTQKARIEAKNFIAIHSTYEDTREEISAKIRDMVQSTNQAVLKEHTSFDEDTSLYFDPEGQRWWLDRVEEQLLKTTPK